MTPQQLEEIKARCEVVLKHNGSVAPWAEAVAELARQDVPALLDEVDRLRATGKTALCVLAGLESMAEVMAALHPNMRKDVEIALAGLRSALSPDGGGEGEQTQKETGHE